MKTIALVTMLLFLFGCQSSPKIVAQNEEVDFFGAPEKTSSETNIKFRKPSNSKIDLVGRWNSECVVWRAPQTSSSNWSKIFIRQFNADGTTLWITKTYSDDKCQKLTKEVVISGAVFSYKEVMDGTIMVSENRRLDAFKAKQIDYHSSGKMTQENKTYEIKDAKSIVNWSFYLDGNTMYTHLMNYRIAAVSCNKVQAKNGKEYCWTFKREKN